MTHGVCQGSTRGFPALVLNADFRPLSYYPLSLCPWQDAVRSVFMDRVEVISQYDQVIHSPSFAMRLPSVIALKDYVRTKQWPAFTRFNVFLRDRFTCQYCDSQRPASELTFDHVVPRSRGGRTNWENIVTACEPCNLQKADKILSQTPLNLRRLPVRPTNFDLIQNGRHFPPNYLHESWRDFLYWDTELEKD